MIEHKNIISDYHREYIIGDEPLEEGVVYVMSGTHLWGRVTADGENKHGGKTKSYATFEPLPDFEHFTDRVSVTYAEGVFFKLCPRCEEPRGLDEFDSYICQECR